MDSDMSSSVKRPFFSHGNANKKSKNAQCTTPPLFRLSVHRTTQIRLFVARLAATRFSIFCYVVFQHLDEEMVAKKSSSGGGGIKGFLTRAGSSFYAGGLYAREKGMWLAQKAGRIGFIIATTSIVTLTPLIFEITREGQVCSHVRLPSAFGVGAVSASYFLIIPCRLCS